MGLEVEILGIKMAPQDRKLLEEVKQGLEKQMEEIREEGRKEICKIVAEVTTFTKEQETELVEKGILIKKEVAVEK